MAPQQGNGTISTARASVDKLEVPVVSKSVMDQPDTRTADYEVTLREGPLFVRRGLSEFDDAYSAVLFGERLCFF